MMLHDRSLINPPRMKFEKKICFFIVCVIGIVQIINGVYKRGEEGKG